MTNVYAVYDTIGTDVLALHLAKADPAAMRWFTDLLSQNAQLGAHAEDYHLIRIGQLAEDEARLSEEYQREIVITGAQVRAAQTTREANQ